MRMQIPKSDFIQILKEPCASYEGVLQAEWNRIPLRTKFRTAAGHEFEVLSRGVWNLEAGPDFRGAKILLDGVLRKGDVEVHVKRSDWLRHRHASDSAYSNIILHVVRENDSSSDTMETFVLPEQPFPSAPPFLTEPQGKCASLFAAMPLPELLHFFRRAGFERVLRKSDSVLKEMISSGMEKAWLRKLFEVCGAKRNREAFGKLFEAVTGNYPASLFRTEFEPLIWGESGLLPAGAEHASGPETFGRAHALWERWWSLRHGTEQSLPWHRGGARPLNTPERETAALIALLRANGTEPVSGWFDLMMNSASPKQAAERILDSLRCSDPFWETHGSFHGKKFETPAVLVGNVRAVLLAVDAVMPCLAACARLRENAAALDRLPLLFEALPAQGPNSVTRRVTAKWLPPGTAQYFRDAASCQGLHHIDSEFCSKVSGDCGACVLYRSFR